MSEDIDTLLRQWRTDCATKLETGERELAAAQTAVADARAADAIAGERWREVNSRVTGALRIGNFINQGATAPIAGPVAGVLAVEKRARDTAAGALTRAKREVESRQFRLADLRDALAQLDRALMPPAVPATAVVAPFEVDHIIEFPSRGAVVA
ncbi:MAG TPA: hypothetical protein VKF83_10415 [Stellaceae bacterium]|nr:hypothetical protein [Stellaceae bacterium]